MDRLSLTPHPQPTNGSTNLRHVKLDIANLICIECRSSCFGNRKYCFVLLNTSSCSARGPLVSLNIL